MPDEHRSRGEALPIPASVRDLIVRHCEAAYPEEACGALFGARRAGRVPLVARALPMRNSARRPGEGYRIEPGELERACVAAGERAESLIGFYHSHPERTASPSGSDLTAAMPGTWYVILPVRNGRAGARKAWFSGDTGPQGARCLN